MANQEHLDILKQGVDVWNKWRESHPTIKPNLSEAFLEREELNKINLEGANLTRAKLIHARLKQANLQHAELMGAEMERAYLRYAKLIGANLTEARLSKATISKADLTCATLRNANLYGAHLRKANLYRANLNGATLDYAQISETNLEGAILTNCCIYGISVWRVEGTPAEQSNLVISRDGEATVTVDNIKVAQFIYLLLNNPEIREAIDTIGKKAVLILGRFTPKRKAILDALREELRNKNFLPIIFDFDAPATKNLTETVSTLAHMSRFVIADITQAKSIPQELGRIVPMLPSVPVQPIIQSGAGAYSMFDDFYDWASVLPLFTYRSQKHLLTSLESEVISPATARASEIEKRRKERQQNQRRG